MRFFSVLILALCFCACGADVSVEGSKKASNTIVSEIKAANPSVLEDFPSELAEENCGCYLRPANSGEELFFAFDWQGKGGGKLRIDGNDVLLARGASIKTDNVKYDGYLHQDKNWTVQTSINEQGPANGKGKIYTGRINIRNQETGYKAALQVKGVCSCK